MNTVQIDLKQSRLHVVDQGDGPPILFVHGFPLDHQMWDSQIDHFSKTHRVICPDLAGFGQSRTTLKQMSMRQMADDMAELINILNIPNVVWCGLSMGGYVGWEFYQHHRHRLTGIVACDTRVVSDSIETARARRMIAEGMLKEMQPDEADRKKELMADTMLPKLFAAKTELILPEAVSQTRQVIQSTPESSIALAHIAMANRSDFSKEITHIDIPTLVVCGEHDSISTAIEMKEFAANIPGARFCEIAEAGHMAPMENPTEFNEALEQFLSASD